MKKVFKWIGIVLGSLVGLVLIAVATLYFIGNARFNKTYDFPASNITIPTDAESIAYGEHRAETLCEGCHGKDLSGVDNWFSAGPLGTVDSANLTSGDGGVGQEFTTEDYVRAIRHGIDPQGKPIFMPAVISGAHVSDEDLGAIIAYIKTVPPVDHKTTGQHFTPLAKILLTLGKLGALPVEAVSHETHVSAPVSAVSVEYGEYLVNTHDCRVCHGPNLTGGLFPDPTITVVAPNITPSAELGSWTEEQFIATLRTGVTPAGRELNPDYMPWKEYQSLYDDELKAIYMYLESLPN
ncbi:hypothetical protein MASR2M66_28450 [Chloroflexota bacterium]